MTISTNLDFHTRDLERKKKVLELAGKLRSLGGEERREKLYPINDEAFYMTFFIVEIFKRAVTEQEIDYLYSVANAGAEIDGAEYIELKHVVEAFLYILNIPEFQKQDSESIERFSNLLEKLQNGKNGNGNGNGNGSGGSQGTPTP